MNGQMSIGGAVPGRVLVDLAVVEEFPADGFFGYAVGQDFFVEPLDAVEDAGEG